jgi:hypothetical protein
MGAFYTGDKVRRGAAKFHLQWQTSSSSSLSFSSFYSKALQKTPSQPEKKGEREEETGGTEGE